MTILKKRFSRYLPIVGFIMLFTLSSAYTPVPKTGYYDFGDLKSKSYYTKIFDKSELKSLASAQKAFAKGESDLAKAELNFKKMDGYQKISDNAVAPKDIKKAQSKVEKYKGKALKYAFNGYEDLLPANKETFVIYKKKLEETNITDEGKLLKVRKIQSDVLRIFAEGSTAEKTAAGLSGLDKYNQLSKADSIQYSAIKLQELAFGIIYNDKDAKYELPEDTTKTDTAKADTSKTDTTKTDTTKTDTTKTDTTKVVDNNTKPDYNVDEDTNIYKSKAEMILPKLSLTSQEKSAYANTKTTQKEAELLVIESNKKFDSVDALKTQLKSETDKTKKAAIQSKISDTETLLYADMIKAANLNLQSTETLYTIYKAHFAESRPTSAPDRAKKGLEYEKNAVKLYNMAKSTTESANFQPYKSDEYLMLMEALQMSLFAVQEQENAYSIYYGFTPTPIPAGNVADNSTSTPNNTTKVDTTKTNTNKTTKTPTYNFLGTYVYTKAQPKPMPIKHKNGIVYKIQAGVFKDLLPIDKYETFEPISYDVFKNNSYQRFMFGEYRSTEQVETKLKEVQKSGFSDAYIVAYVDGKRTSYKNVKDKIAEGKLTPESTDTSKSDYELPELNYGSGTYDFVKGTDVTKTKDLVYAVQFGMWKMPKTNAEIKGISPLLQEVTKDGVKYMQGPYSTLNAAQAAKGAVETKGFKGAFVTAYNNGEHIELGKAKKIEQSKTVKKEEPKQPEVFFAVQIGAYAAELTPDKKAEFEAIGKDYPLSITTDDKGLKIYSVGKYTSYQEGTIIKNKLKAAGYVDVFLIAFKGTQKITVTEALELLK